jgi:hypothetical protein
MNVKYAATLPDEDFCQDCKAEMDSEDIGRLTAVLVPVYLKRQTRVIHFRSGLLNF